jgi:hypothetical protein
LATTPFYFMATNGKRRPPRPAFVLIGPAAVPAEAAAIAAALERFLHDTAPVIAPSTERESPWARAARAESVCGGSPNAWGDPEPWGN